MKNVSCGTIVLPVILALLGIGVGRAQADPAVPMKIMAKMPVKEVTVFKDGHAFMLHEGEMPTGDGGSVVMDYLPAPVMGTFWPYCSQKGVTLRSVRAGKRRLLVERTALNVRQLLEANVGADAHIKENSGAEYEATILGVPTRSAEEIQATGLPNADEALPQKGEVILLKTAKGVKVVPIGSIKDVTFNEPPKTGLADEELRNMLTLDLDWGRRKPAQTAQVGMVYLQRGIRWIPGYKVTIDGKGNARIQLQATLINELTDLDNVTANLVIGVPTFAFKDSVDPISLQAAVAQLSQHFRPNAQTAFAFSNAIMTQTANMRPVAPRPTAGGMDLGPEIGGAGANEDLYVFQVKGIGLKKGERMVLTVAEYSLKYKDVYTLDVGMAPPPEIRRNFNNDQQREMARLLHAPKVIHKIRLANDGQYPLTTAPALIVSDDKVLAQGLMTYTAVGASTDLAITTAVNVQVQKVDAEIKRTPNAVSWQGHRYARIDLSGKIRLTNHGKDKIDLEVTRLVLGKIDEAGQDGKVEQSSLFDLEAFLGAYPNWWSWHSWPYWWNHFNGVGRVTWQDELEAGKAIELTCTWHYYYR